MNARIVLALNRPTLQRQLKRRLTAPDVVVDALGGGTAEMWDRLSREVCDLLIVSLTRVPKPTVETVTLFTQLPESPAVVVVASDDDPEQRAQLLAAGCQAVLDENISLNTFTDALHTVLAQQQELAHQRLAARRAIVQPRLSDFVSNSGTMQSFVQTVHRVVNTDVSLLILGETGVGKERLARAVHNEGPRANGPFIAINCGALPETLLESELFGHEQGAFTGATRSRRGCFELAHGGTVFLDEIGDLPLHLQVNLLTVVQDHEVRRLGSERSVNVDVRIMAATNRDIEAEVEAKQFRRDLYYRLNVMRLEIPPLRERREDIPELATNYVAYLRPRVGREVYQIEPVALDALINYAWPGNVRELINVIERAMILCTGDTITLRDLPVTVAEGTGVGAALQAHADVQHVGYYDTPDGDLPPWKTVRDDVLDRVERDYLIALLKHTGGRINETAYIAGMRTRSLYEKMKHHRLRKEDYKRHCN